MIGDADVEDESTIRGVISGVLDVLMVLILKRPSLNDDAFTHEEEPSMSEALRSSQTSPMSNKDKFKALLKQVAVSAAMNAVPGTVQFIAEVGHKAYELWLASPPEERESFRVGARELSEAERAMRGVDEQVAHIQSATFNVVQRGQDLLQVGFDSISPK